MHIPLTLVLTVLTLTLSCVPAVLIWTIFSNLMDSTISWLSNSTNNGIGELSSSVQDLLLRNSLHPLNARILAGDIEVVSQENLLHATKLMDLDLHPNVTDISTQVLDRIRGYNFHTIKGNSMFSYITMEGVIFPNGEPPGKTAYWIVWQVLNYDIYKATMGLYPYVRTIYLCTVQLSKDETEDVMEIWYVDQETGEPLLPLQSTSYPWQGFAYWYKEERANWSPDLYVNPYSAQVELIYVKNVYTADSSRGYAIGLGLNTQTLSAELLSQLSDPNDRLFLFFRNIWGHLIAASHGKFFSLSDKDLRFIDPLSNPPNMSQYQFYTCFESTDALILEACQKLIAQYQNWSLIPESRQEMQLNNSRYWVAVGYSTSSVNATMVLLKDRESIMGSIDASTAKAKKDTDDKRGVSAIVLGVAMAVAATLPMSIGLWLGNRLLQLGRGMDCIAKLDFRRLSFPEARFRELHDFQQSFQKMERGLRAFGKFVPSAVVMRLVAGHIHTDDNMETSTITVMFADIENFSTFAETLGAAQLAEVCTEYFEVMCKHVVQCDGTVDKFIGDCVMAMWNAPLPRPNHERSAVTAALRMQADVLLLHDVWRQRGLPTLKFRMGIHTGPCLVGNFGCSYRVSYTCLGENVILASQLEALNKKFGTTLCVSQHTHDRCQNDFHFRHLSKVAVRGRSQVLSVYEVICAVDAASKAGEAAAWAANNLSPSQRSMLEDIRLESVETPRESGKVQPKPSKSELHGEESAKEIIAEGPQFVEKKTTFCDQDTGIPYHWGWCDRQAVLKEVTEYEVGCTALVEGQYAECRKLVAKHHSDKVWQALAAQLEQQMSSSQPWDGVFNFK